ncbi:prolyl-tRNA synthetase associated domain-containing protein [Candidatus Peregrinibacteria bacterium]|nr:prolyl-tRNA synthetase associated domain-containing protein [Candidatus Peregrinibacteria bacterium]
MIHQNSFLSIAQNHKRLRCEKFLEELEIKYVKHEHPALFTVEDSAKYDLQMEGAHSKNLFLRNDKGDKHFLVIMDAHKRANLKELGQKIGEKKLSFASPDRMMRYLGLTPGSVSPFGLINNSDKNVIVIVDKWLLDQPIVNFHPNVNTATLGIGRDDFLKFLQWCGNEVMEIEL